MHFAFVLFRYFPYGGLQRDFLSILRACQSRGARVTVFTRHWEGPIPDDIRVRKFPGRALTRTARLRQFEDFVLREKMSGEYDAIVGFNRMAGLDHYFAADSCFAAKALGQRGPLYRLTPRSRLFLRQEASVLGSQSNTHVLFLSALQRDHYLRHYPLPETRYTLLPPGIDISRRAPPDRRQVRQECRQELGLGEDEWLLIQVGSGFRVKGVDRSLRALAALPETQRRNTHYLMVGQDDPRPFMKLAKRLGISAKVHFPGGRDDIPRLLQAADLMLHPAYSESAGLAIVEAMVAGLPVLTTDTCGHARHVMDADAGRVCPSPFRQADLNRMLTEMLDRARLDAWEENALVWAENPSLYRQAETMADLLMRSN